MVPLRGWKLPLLESKKETPPISPEIGSFSAIVEGARGGLESYLNNLEGLF